MYFCTRIPKTKDTYYQMKRIFIMVVAALMATLSAQAQKDIPANMRIEVSEVESDNAAYTIFTYKDDDGTFGYYLSLGGSAEIFSISYNDVSDFSIADARETCILLGATAADAFAMLDSLQEMCNKEAGTVREFPGRTTAGAEQLTTPNTTRCEVKKRLIGSNRLLFTFTSGKRQCGIYLTKGVIKQLRFGLKTDMKLHPKMHR